MLGQDRENISLQREEIIKKIGNWSKESGLSLEKMILPGYESAPYAGKVQVGKNLGYNILFAEENNDFFYVTTYFRFQGTDGKALYYLDSIKQQQFIREIKISLLQMNISYIFLPASDNEIIDFRSLESLDIHKQIFFDGFSKNSFFEAVNSVIHAVELIYHYYKRFSDSLFPR